MGVRELLKTLEGGVWFSLVLKPKQEVANKAEIPKEVQEMLKEYNDIVSDRKPATLPPKRPISHQNDFIPGATLLNKSTYKMTPQ